ncbi:MAG: fatty acid CoA ligase family protein [Thermodesulfobacteriota bacterium]|nr:fatty acid CoA ligase family protein [Thermodesulfobacteriota bacterium]
MVEHADKDRIINIANRMTDMAQKQPYKKAVIAPHGRDSGGRVTYAHFTFAQLDADSSKIADGLGKAGITRGTRTILMVRPSLDFFSLVFGLFKAGIVPVVVDPGMGIKRMVSCFAETEPQAFIGIPLAHVVRKVYGNFFKTVETWVTVGKRWFWGGYTLEDIRAAGSDTHTTAPTLADEIAAVLFTTGSTGPAKGVIYTHGMFDAQIQHIQDHFQISLDEIDLPTFPLFALFDPALGMTAVIPDMDPTRPAFVDPEKIIEGITNHGVTNMFASPALLNRVGGYCVDQDIKLPSLRRVVSAGAPVHPANIEQFAHALTGYAEIHTPYGASEAVPVISISSREILSDTKRMSEQGFGNCVGRPLEGISARLIKISDDPVEEWSDDLLVPQGEVGEIVVKGGLVTRSYYNRPEDTALAKIMDADGFWHRMGDLAWMDHHGRFWFCGRKSHRVVCDDKTLFTIPCEAIFNNHPHVARSALVGVGDRGSQKPVICIETAGEQTVTNQELVSELLELAKTHELTKDIETVLIHKGFPVDIRHNAKIFREKLAAWAQGKVK